MPQAGPAFSNYPAVLGCPDLLLKKRKKNKTVAGITQDQQTTNATCCTCSLWGVMPNTPHSLRLELGVIQNYTNIIIIYLTLFTLITLILVLLALGCFFLRSSNCLPFCMACCTSCLGAFQSLSNRPLEECNITPTLVSICLICFLCEINILYFIKSYHKMDEDGYSLSLLRE